MKNQTQVFIASLLPKLGFKDPRLYSSRILQEIIQNLYVKYGDEVDNKDFQESIIAKLDDPKALHTSTRRTLSEYKFTQLNTIPGSLNVLNENVLNENVKNDRISEIPVIETYTTGIHDYQNKSRVQGEPHDFDYEPPISFQAQIDLGKKEKENSKPDLQEYKDILEKMQAVDLQGIHEKIDNQKHNAIDLFSDSELESIGSSDIYKETSYSHATHLSKYPGCTICIT